MLLCYEKFINTPYKCYEKFINTPIFKKKSTFCRMLKYEIKEKIYYYCYDIGLYFSCLFIQFTITCQNEVLLLKSTFDS